MHDADKDGARRDRAAKIVGIDQARFVNGEIGDLRAQPLQKSARLDNCLMLNLGCDDALTLFAEREKMPLRARLLASLPPLVKTISSFRQPSSRRHLVTG